MHVGVAMQVHNHANTHIQRQITLCALVAMISSNGFASFSIKLFSAIMTSQNTEQVVLDLLIISITIFTSR